MWSPPRAGGGVDVSPVRSSSCSRERHEDTTHRIDGRCQAGSGWIEVHPRKQVEYSLELTGTATGSEVRGTCSHSELPSDSVCLRGQRSRDFDGGLGRVSGLPSRVQTNPYDLT